MNSRCKAKLAPLSQKKLLFHISVLAGQIVSLWETVAAIYSSVGSRCPYGLLPLCMSPWAGVFKIQFDLNPYWLNLVLSLHHLSHDFESTLSYTVCFSYTITVSNTYGMLHRTDTIWLQSELEQPWDSLRVSLACQCPKPRDVDPTNASIEGDMTSPSHNFSASH